MNISVEVYKIRKNIARKECGGCFVRPFSDRAANCPDKQCVDLACFPSAQEIDFLEGGAFSDFDARTNGTLLDASDTCVGPWGQSHRLSSQVIP